MELPKWVIYEARESKDDRDTNIPAEMIVAAFPDAAAADLWLKQNPQPEGRTRWVASREPEGLPKFIQLVGFEGEAEQVMWALGDDGTVWIHGTGKGWDRLDADLPVVPGRNGD